MPPQHEGRRPARRSGELATARHTQVATAETWTGFILASLMKSPARGIREARGSPTSRRRQRLLLPVLTRSLLKTDRSIVALAWGRLSDSWSEVRRIELVVDHIGQFPGQVVGVTDPGIHALTDELGVMCAASPARKISADPPPVGDEGIEGVDQLAVDDDISSVDVA